MKIKFTDYAYRVTGTKGDTVISNLITWTGICTKEQAESMARSQFMTEWHLFVGRDEWDEITVVKA